MQSNFAKLQRDLKLAKQKKKFEARRLRRFDKRDLDFDKLVKSDSAKINATDDSAIPKRQTEDDAFEKLIAQVSAKKRSARIEESRLRSGMPVSIAQYFADASPFKDTMSLTLSSIGGDTVADSLNSDSQSTALKLLPTLVPTTRLTDALRKEWWHKTRLHLRTRISADLFLRIGTAPAIGRRKHAVTGKPTRAMAMDCEMVGVGYKGNKSVLARVSIVNEKGLVCYDQFVKAVDSLAQIRDYRTHVSGVTEMDLKKGSVPFDQCMREVFDILKGRVVVGHSLENDWAVMAVMKDKLRAAFYQLNYGPIKGCAKKRKAKKESDGTTDSKRRKIEMGPMRHSRKLLSGLFDTRTDEQKRRDGDLSESSGKKSGKMQPVKVEDLDLSAKARGIAKKLLSDSMWIWDSATIAPLHGYPKEMPKPTAGRPWVRRRALRHLCELFLGIHIQSGEHDSVQDAMSGVLLHSALKPETDSWAAERRRDEKAQRKLETKRQRIVSKKLKEAAKSRKSQTAATTTSSKKKDKAKKRKRKTALDSDFAELHKMPTFGL